MADKNRDLEGRDLLLGRPEGASRMPPGVSSQSAEELLRAAEGLRQAVEDLRSAARERDEDLLRKILAAAQAAEPRVDSIPQEELLRELLEALRTLRADPAWPGDSTVAEDTAHVRELGERVLAAHRAADAATEAVVALRGQAVAARAASEEVLRRPLWRPWLVVPGAVAAAVGVLFLGAVAQMEFGVVTDLRREWNAYVAERYASLIAVCAAKANLDNDTVSCRLEIDPPPVTVPFYPGGTIARPPGGGSGG